MRTLTAEVISCPGRLGDVSYAAVQINMEGFDSPYVLTLALPAIGCRALAAQVDPILIYNAIAQAVNGAGIKLP
jgi:hypothetical protein